MKRKSSCLEIGQVEIKESKELYSVKRRKLVKINKRENTKLFQTFWQHLTEGTYEQVLETAQLLKPILVNDENRSRAWNHFWSSMCPFSKNKEQEEKILQILTNDSRKQLWYMCLMKFARINFAFAKDLHNNQLSRAKKATADNRFDWHHVGNGKVIFAALSDKKTRIAFLEEFYWKFDKPNHYERMKKIERAIYADAFPDHYLWEIHYIHEFFKQGLVGGYDYINAYCTWLQKYGEARYSGNYMSETIALILSTDANAFWILSCLGYSPEVRRQHVTTFKRVPFMETCPNCGQKTTLQNLPFRFQMTMDSFQNFHDFCIEPNEILVQCCLDSNTLTIEGSTKFSVRSLVDFRIDLNIENFDFDDQESKTNAFELFVGYPYQNKLTEQVSNVKTELEIFLFGPLGNLVMDYVLNDKT